MKTNRDLLPEGEQRKKIQKDPAKHDSLGTKSFRMAQAKISVSAQVIHNFATRISKSEHWGCK